MVGNMNENNARKKIKELNQEIQEEPLQLSPEYFADDLREVNRK